MVARWTWQPGTPVHGAPRRAGKLDRHFGVLAALEDSDLSPTARHLIRAIEDFADNATGEAWPSLVKLTKVTGYSRQTVITGIAEAVAKGWLAVDRGGASKGSNHYRVTPPPPKSGRRVV